MNKMGDANANCDSNDSGDMVVEISPFSMEAVDPKMEAKDSKMEAKDSKMEAVDSEVEAVDSEVEAVVIDLKLECENEDQDFEAEDSLVIAEHQIEIDTSLEADGLMTGTADSAEVLPAVSEVLPAGSEVLPAVAEVLPAGFEVLPAGAEVHSAISDFLPAVFVHGKLQDTLTKKKKRRSKKKKQSTENLENCVPAKPRPENPLTKPRKLSAELATLLGVDPELEMMSRCQVVKAVWVHIKAHKLQDEIDKKMVNPDQSMQPVFGHQQLQCFGMFKHLKGHLL